MRESDGQDEAVSALQATLLLVAITMILAALIFLKIPLFFSLDLGMTEPPCIFEIASIKHIDDVTGTMNWDSRVTLRYNRTPVSFDIRNPDDLMHRYLGTEKENTDRTEWYIKDDLSAQFFRNGAPLFVKIPTLDAHKFIPTHHYGVQYMTGTDSHWCPGGSITIDFNDGTFRSGDVVRVEIYSNTDGRLISADTYTA